MPARLRIAAMAGALGAVLVTLAAAIPAGVPTVTGSTVASINVDTAGASASVDPPAGALPAAAGVSQLRGREDKGQSVTVDPNGVVRTVVAAPDTVLHTDVDAFVTKYAAAFGLTSGQSFVKTASVPMPDGVVYRYVQHVAGLPVLGDRWWSRRRRPARCSALSPTQASGRRSPAARR